MATGERGHTLPRSLYGVAPFSSVVSYDKHKLPYVVEKIATPTDKIFDIPQRIALLRNVLSTLEVAYVWSGGHTVHHIAWHGEKFKKIPNDVGIDFRECNTLKVRIPSELHAYIHAVTEETDIPEVEYMKEYRHEYNTAERLAATLSPRSFDASPARHLSQGEQSKRRLDSYLSKVDRIEEPVMGILPSKEELLSMDIEQARIALNSIVEIQGFTNERSSKQAFFNMAA